MRHLIAGFVLILVLLPRIDAAYTFTSVDGRAVEAEIVEVSDSSITIQRSSDGRTFELEISRLIPDDAVYIGKWIERNQPMEDMPVHRSKEIGKWPRKLKPDNYDIVIVKEDNDTCTYVYRTPHFEFQSNVKLARRVVREVSQIFESTLLVIADLPLGFNPKVSEDTFFSTQMFETEGQYLTAGGVPNSAGVYFRDSRKIMLPLRHLGVRKTSSSYTIDERGETKVLTHEITHQVMHDWLGKLPIWASEGIAEYVEHVPYERGTFRFDRFEINEVLSRGSSSLTDLEILMNMSLAEWNQALAENPRRAASNYLTVFILYYYFCHMELDEADKPRLLYDYLRVIEAGNDKETATEILLNGRSYEELEAAVKEAYKREDINLGFL